MALLRESKGGMQRDFSARYLKRNSVAFDSLTPFRPLTAVLQPGGGFILLELDFGSKPGTSKRKTLASELSG